MPSSVLVLHDDADTASALCELLAAHGYGATRGTARTVDAIAATRPTLVVLDVPAGRQREAHALLTALRADPRTADVPLLLLAPWTAELHAVSDAVPNVRVIDAPLAGLRLLAAIGESVGYEA